MPPARPAADVSTPMTGPGRWLASSLLLLAALVFPVGLGAPPACAGEQGRAVLVVDTGQTVHDLCVALPDASVSGLELIVLANEQHGLSYRFGYGGGAVCMLAGVGPTGDDCFEEYPDFWGYWRGDGSGGWSWSTSGAGSTTVSDGDVEGWSWGRGNNGETHPRPPTMTFGSVCSGSGDPPATETKPTPDGHSGQEDAPGRRRKRPAVGPSTSSGTQRDRRSEGEVAATAGSERDVVSQRPSGDISPSESRRAGSRRLRPGRDVSHPSAARPGAAPPARSPDGAEEVAASAEDGASPGPPPAGIAAVAIAAVLTGAGSLRARRRRSTGG